MMINKIAICPICKKKTYLRIQDGGYLKEYPIRVNCINCRALIKGYYIMSFDPSKNLLGVQLINADTEDCVYNEITQSVQNADYIAEISGEVPCVNVRKYDGGLPVSPFMRSVQNLETPEDRIVRLQYFAKNIAEWKRTKSIAFQLLDEGSIEFVATALGNRMGDYGYECNNYLKSLQCLHEVVLEETKYLFLDPEQDEEIKKIIHSLAQLDKDIMHTFIEALGGIEELILGYRKVVEIISDFMKVYPNLLPAETYVRFKDKTDADIGIATCSFSDIKSFYQDSYEALLSMLYIPICLDNIAIRSDYNIFSSSLNEVFCKKYKRKDVKCDLSQYRTLDNGTRINKLDVHEEFQRLIDIPANRLLRNGIGHNNVKYDGITQVITAYDLKIPGKINYQNNLMGVAIDCLGLAKSAAVFAEMILFLLRLEFRRDGIRSIIHPRFYKGAEPNEKCPCGSNIKYKKCCMNDVKSISLNKS